MHITGLKLHIATIVDEPENAPTVLVAQSEDELLQKLKDCGELQHLTDLQTASTCEEVSDLWDDAKDEGMMYEYSGVFLSEQEL